MVKSFWLSFFMLVSCVAFALPTATLSLDENKIGVNDITSLTLTLRGVNESDAPDIFDMAGLKITSTGRSSSYQSINGVVERSITYTYEIIARKVGQYYIGPYTINVNGKNIKTNKVQLRVFKKTPTVVDANIILRQRTTRKQYYIGEPVILVTELLFRHQHIRGVSNMNRDGGNFTISEPQQAEQKREVIDGRQFEVASWYQIVTPKELGHLVIPEVYLTLSMSQRVSHSPFDGIFGATFGNLIRKNISAKALTVDIKALPDKGKPKDFSGVVGTYHLQANISQKEVVVGEGVTLKYKISGKGDINLLVSPKLHLPSGIKTYEPEIKKQVDKGRLLSGSLEASQLLVPEKPGKISVGPLVFNYFDTSANKYRQLKAGPFDLLVKPGKQTAITAAAVRAGNKIKLLNTDLLPLKDVTNYHRPNRLWILAIYVVSFIIFVLLRIKKYIANKNNQAGYSRRRNSLKLMRQRLDLAKRDMGSSTTVFCNNLAAILPNFLADKLNLPVASCSGESLRNILKQEGVACKSIEDIVKLNAELDSYRFAGGQLNIEKRKQLLSDYQSLMNAIIKELKV